MLNARKLSAVIVATTITLQASAPRVSAQTPNVVIQWNQTLQALFVGTGPGIHIRALPMMHIAMFDAINSIEERYTPYLGQVKGSHGASAEAAAATAARDVLAALYPAQQADVRHPAGSTQLAGMPPGLARQGEAIGHASRRLFSNGGRTTAGRPPRRPPSLRTRHTCSPRSRVCGSRRRRRTALRRLRSIRTSDRSRC